MRKTSTERLDVFRKNEALRSAAKGLPGPFGFRCECAKARCRELLLVEATDLHELRANPRRLVMANGHESDDERIVLEYDGYVVAEFSELARA